MKSLIFLLALIATQAIAQQAPLKKIKEIKIQADVEHISVDRLGGFYTVSDCGIEQFDADGKKLKRYALDACDQTDLLEAWPLMRVYAYQKSKQQFLIFDHVLDIVEVLKIDPAFAVEPQLAAPSPDLKGYWILDMDNSIKKIDLATQTVAIETDALKNVKGPFTHIREYQSMLFVLDPESGIYIVNKLGQQVAKIEEQGIQYFSFSGEDLYYLKGSLLHFYDIFTKETYSIEVSAGNTFCVATDEKLILIKDLVAEIFAFTPRK